MRTRVRIQPYVAPDLQRKLRAWAAAKNLTESAVAEAAIAEYLDEGRPDQDLISRRLDLLSQAISRLQNDFDLLADAFGRYVRHVFLAALYKSGTDADAKYDAYVRGVLDQSEVGGTFVGEVRRARTRPPAKPPGDGQTGGR
jgi:hypothetical protein